MSWSHILNDVTSRLAAASQSLQRSGPVHLSYSHGASTYTNQGCSTTFSDSPTSSMSVRVHLDQQNAPFYTNLNFVTGRVILSLATETAISAINVKLEGESRTRLMGPKFPNDPRNRQKVDLEVHKLLYKVQTVYPTQNLTQDPYNAPYTLPPGQHTYHFSMKIPFNNDCTNNMNAFQDLRLGPLLISDPTSARHVKQTLPPSLSGFPGQADINYFVKATVVRPQFYRENIRSIVDFKFQPVEPPRPPPRNEEVYARRQHQFQAFTPPSKSSRSSIFAKPNSAPGENQPLAVKVEARLPSPAIISCNKTLPLRILVEKTNNSSASIFLSLLQIELIATTHVRAHDLNRTETGSWVLLSQANMKLQLDNPTDRSARSFQVPSRYWEDTPLPDTVAPSFVTCNISRSYELEVRIGITHGMADGMRPELNVLPLRIPVQVYSGIVPPERAVNRVSTQSSLSATLNSPRPEHAPPQFSPVTPTHDHLPPQTGTYMSPPADDPDDLPPSYEDAIAEDTAPADGPRRDHSSNGTPNTSPQAFRPDIKDNTSGLNRHGSERLFAQNRPVPPSAVPAATTQSTQVSQVTGNSAAGVTGLLAGLNVSNNNTARSERAPRLPARKGTADSTRGRKRAI